MGNTFNYYLHPEVNPYDLTPIEFDPQYGYVEGARKKKEIRVTAAEFESVQMKPEDRDYCSHKLLEYMTCKFKHMPFVRRCEHISHEYMNCEYQEHIDRVKDYERERRLMVRRQRILNKQKKSTSQEIAK